MCPRYLWQNVGIWCVRESYMFVQGDGERRRASGLYSSTSITLLLPNTKSLAKAAVFTHLKTALRYTHTHTQKLFCIYTTPLQLKWLKKCYYLIKLCHSGHSAVMLNIIIAAMRSYCNQEDLTFVHAYHCLCTLDRRDGFNPKCWRGGSEI